MKINASLLRDWGTPTPSLLSREVERRRYSGLPITDLITANPHEHGFLFDPAILRAALEEAATAASVYRPDAKGQLAAREAVAAYHGEAVTAHNVLLTPGTSMSYFYAFRLLAGDGGEILCPSPTYPLFEDIAEIAGASVRRYHLHKKGSHWVLDPEEVRFQLTSRTRAIVVVSPHNPTGSVARKDELEAVCAVSRDRKIPIIFDEVFREFTHDGSCVARPANAHLSLVMNGFSKMFSLPGSKAGWIVAAGDASAVRAFLNSAEYMSDTFLPVSEYTQAMMPLLFRDGVTETRRFAAEYTIRMTQLVNDFVSAGIDAEMPEAGPYLPVALPASVKDSEQFALSLLTETGILVHPGSYYEMPLPGVVLTCVTPPPYPAVQLAHFLSQAPMR